MKVKIGPIPGATRRASARSAILDAAEAVVADIGAKHMTLEAVAKRAQVSKGGLLYHFPTKETLLAAIIERHIGRLSEGANLDQAGPNPADLMAKIIRCRSEAKSNPEGMRTAHGLLAAVAERPSLLAPMRAHNEKLWQLLKSGPGSQQAIIAWLAFEGLMAMEIFNTTPIGQDERPGVIQALLQLLTEAAASPKSLP